MYHVSPVNADCFGVAGVAGGVVMNSCDNMNSSILEARPEDTHYSSQVGYIQSFRVN